jgi:hypothetical protein
VVVPAVYSLVEGARERYRNNTSPLMPRLLARTPTFRKKKS